MRTLILLVLAAFLAVAPLSARAQTAPAPAPAPTQAAPASTTIFGLPPAQALAVGVGVIVGGVGMSALTNGPFATVVGGVAGALIGNWWYATRPTITIQPTRQQLSAVE